VSGEAQAAGSLHFMSAAITLPLIFHANISRALESDTLPWYPTTRSEETHGG